MKTLKIFVAILLFLLSLVITMKIVVFIITVAGALGLTVFDIHVSESQRAHDDLEAFANILGLLAGVWVGVKCYKYVAKNNIKEIVKS